MTSINERLSDTEIGERLRIARESRKMTQAQAANVIEAARTTIVAIEQGKRRVQIDELQRLASAYGTSANAILRRTAIHTDMMPRFRRLQDSESGAVEQASRLLNDLVRAEVELEDSLGITRQRRYPPERPILPGDLYIQAEQHAQELRDWLGLGPGPVTDMVSILDLQLGVRVYVRRLDSKVAGLFAYDDRAGACILLNASHPFERITQSAAHEAGHFISTRHEPEVLTEDEQFISREERYANIFQRCFLTPGREVRQRFAELTAGQSHLTRHHVILLAHSFLVSREAIVRRMEELGLAKPGTWNWFMSHGGITSADVRQVLGEVPARPNYSGLAQGLVPPRLALLAREAWKRELYSEGQLAGMLQLDLHGVREVLDGAEREESEEHELVRIPL
jgi:Zn-dependent peptidase ImmA (M78 family)